MLRTLAKGPLHLALGRGTAKSEYDAYGVAMPEARGRFAATWEIMRQGLSGEEFTHAGRFWQFERPFRLRHEPRAGTEALRAWKESVSSCIVRWSTYHSK